MSFIYILLVVLGITSFAYLAKLSAKNGISSFDFTFVMFATAGVLGYLFAEFNHVETASYTFELCSVSALAGLGGATAVFVFNNSVRMGHFGYSNAIYRSSFLIPVIFSVIFFRATLNIITITGILFILTSIVLASWSNDAFSRSKNHGNMLWFFMIIGAFALSGLPRIGQLLISHHKLNSFAYLFMSYAAGFILLLIFFLLFSTLQALRHKAKGPKQASCHHWPSPQRRSTYRAATTLSRFEAPRSPSRLHRTRCGSSRTASK
jgi:drug/metabolite transporter (DMT)-like permease